MYHLYALAAYLRYVLLCGWRVYGITGARWRRVYDLLATYFSVIQRKRHLLHMRSGGIKNQRGVNDSGGGR